MLQETAVVGIEGIWKRNRGKMKEAGREEKSRISRKNMPFAIVMVSIHCLSWSLLFSSAK